MQTDKHTNTVCSVLKEPEAKSRNKKKQSYSTWKGPRGPVGSPASKSITSRFIDC
jgi:hypothetical protein